MTDNSSPISRPVTKSTVAFETTLSRQLADLQGHRSDLMTALHGLDALDAVQTYRDQAIASGSAAEALWTGIVVAYIRCFNQGLRTRLVAEQIFAGLNGGLDYHQHIFSLRQQHYAHDVNELRQTQTIIDVSTDGKILDVGVIVIHADRDPTMKMQMKNLVTHALNFVDQEFDRLLGEVKREAEGLNPADLKALSPFQYVVPSTEGGTYKSRKLPRR